jgi:cell division protease FtsH
MGAFERAYRILETNREVLERCARELLERETLEESDIRKLTQGLKPAAEVAEAPVALPRR